MKLKPNDKLRRTRTIPEAADYLGIGVAHAYKCARSGELPVVRIGRRYVVPVAALERMLGEHERAPVLNGAWLEEGGN